MTVVPRVDGTADVLGPRGRVGRLAWEGADGDDARCSLEAPPVHLVEGTLLHHDGTPAATTQITSRCAGDRRPTRTREDGAFRMELTAAADGSPCRIEALLLLEGRTLGVELPPLEGDLTGLSLTLPPAEGAVAHEERLTDDVRALAEDQLRMAREELAEVEARWRFVDDATADVAVLEGWREDRIDRIRRRVERLETHLERLP